MMPKVYPRAADKRFLRGSWSFYGALDVLYRQAVRDGTLLCQQVSSSS